MRVFIILIITTFYSCFVLAELPSGNATISGDISITSNDQSMTIQQQSDQAIIEWNSFNIGENNTVTFNQPSSSSSALNSFYDPKFYKNKERQLDELKNFIHNLEEDGNIVFVTHYVVIASMFGIRVSSGEILVTDKDLNVIGTIEDY